MGPATPLIEVRDIEKRFRRIPVLRKASMVVGRGDIVGLVGENGSGKTTLLRIVAGMLGADSGQVRQAGSIGYCPQAPVLFESLTIEQNLTYFGAAYRLSGAEVARRGGSLMERLRCDHYGGRPVSQLSGGTQQKLNLIVALLHEPDVLLLDEPYQGLDYDAYLAFWELATELTQGGRGVVIVSHLMHDRSRVSRLYRLVDGRAIGE